MPSRFSTTAFTPIFHRSSLCSMAQGVPRSTSWMLLGHTLLIRHCLSRSTSSSASCAFGLGYGSQVLLSEGLI
ncbi:uncharacterized protein SCHCODRAFT_02001380 [Schizophyllum commune H4-8]|uniref:uncharacterized protein n=1 Tax=Schizophyllum commune (strain H4-8 / FGSC 9210) TaxID=578458 RepID=UPI00215EB990|nr:uncharacterized protein SCHCODRAFT_02001380 [Schizophyllum commune H4-8]KAI5899065.1 hypothetical protein SCHCODRAFT_02001380 [Schizophyllum commune H4-8]